MIAFLFYSDLLFDGGHSMHHADGKDCRDQ